MKLLGNLIWLVFGGLWGAICWALGGLIFCITIIGIPFGLQCFKFASLCLTPFGMQVQTEASKHPIANIIWLVFFGLWMAIAYFIVGIVFCITIIGIPFGLQYFKFARLSLFPFGALITSKELLKSENK
ncbi:YccF domain-containing protein [Helicobacter sp. 13S00477-4]|uniref:YccF domain-containing protein n=1 Tax=Helicobacter sp. 13S00477-4 TaxID=1905759 RepID=UPI000BA50B45|nr:YccF domain-containing protein [Helicobacter sp. 13S00477-4]PAF50483.1 hypothetical protein BKH44_08205 [Helicobacter sp. 13S00477-4]